MSRKNWVDQVLMIPLTPGRNITSGTELKWVWLFGGIERISKTFLEAINRKLWRRRIQGCSNTNSPNSTYPGPIIYSDRWLAYVQIPEPRVHTPSTKPQQRFCRFRTLEYTYTVERLWRTLKENVIHSGKKTMLLVF